MRFRIGIRSTYNFTVEAEAKTSENFFMLLESAMTRTKITARKEHRQRFPGGTMRRRYVVKKVASTSFERNPEQDTNRKVESGQINQSEAAYIRSRTVMTKCWRQLATEEKQAEQDAFWMKEIPPSAPVSVSTSSAPGWSRRQIEDRVNQ
jgi:hypothetical protein